MSWVDDYDASWSEAGETGNSDSGPGCFIAVIVAVAVVVVCAVVTMLLNSFGVDFPLLTWLFEAIGWLLGKIGALLGALLNLLKKIF